VTRDLAGSGSRGALPDAHRLAVGEGLGLRWSEIDLARRTARLADTKTGLSIRPLSHAACDVLTTMPRVAGELLFPATRGGEGRIMTGFKKYGHASRSSAACRRMSLRTCLGIRSLRLPATLATASRRLPR